MAGTNDYPVWTWGAHVCLCEGFSCAMIFHTVCFVFIVLQTGKYDQIMRWWSSNLGQGLIQS